VQQPFNRIGAKLIGYGRNNNKADAGPNENEKRDNFVGEKPGNEVNFRDQKFFRRSNPA
jgi:hypothetical protein